MQGAEPNGDQRQVLLEREKASLVPFCNLGHGSVVPVGEVVDAHQGHAILLARRHRAGEDPTHVKLVLVRKPNDRIKQRRLSQML